MLLITAAPSIAYPSTGPPSDLAISTNEVPPVVAQALQSPTPTRPASVGKTYSSTTIGMAIISPRGMSRRGLFTSPAIVDMES
jgi:hypothetical protein